MPSSPDDALALAELAEAEAAEAEAAEAEALAAAAAARARTAKRRAKAAASSQPASSEPEEAEPDDGDEPEEVRRRRWSPPRPSAKALLVTAASLVLVAGLTAAALMLVRHHTVSARQDREAAFVAATRQSVVNLLSMSHQSAKEDVQRVLDGSTGEFRADFEDTANDFITTVQQSEAVVTAVVNAVGVQSLDGDTAQMLVSAATSVTNVAGAQNDPRAFRLVVTMVDEGGQIKMSRVELVP